MHKTAPGAYQASRSLGSTLDALPFVHLNLSFRYKLWDSTISCTSQKCIHCILASPYTLARMTQTVNQCLNTSVCMCVCAFSTAISFSVFSPTGRVWKFGSSFNSWHVREAKLSCTSHERTRRCKVNRANRHQLFSGWLANDCSRVRWKYVQPKLCARMSNLYCSISCLKVRTLAFQASSFKS